MTLAFLGGFLPALFWLWFWLRQDKKNPEPKRLIIISFIAGMLVVPIVLPLEKYALAYYTGQDLVLAWVVVEEVLKYAAALIVILWHRAVDEPIDVMIYMITIALGFAALENALFIFLPLSAGEFAQSFVTGNFRFIGATLLHVLASGTVGAAMALAFYRPRIERVLWATVGLFIAIVLHALFNSFIMDPRGGETILTVFLCVWMGIIVLFLVFEKVKQLKRAR